jgi:hypothetical protein
VDEVPRLRAVAVDSQRAALVGLCEKRTDDAAVPAVWPARSR